jgi:hypothetical protein
LVELIEAQHGDARRWKYNGGLYKPRADVASNIIANTRLGLAMGPE